MDLTGGIVQVAYVVTDLRAAAERLIATTGAGPFFLREHIAIRECTYRGAPATLDHSNVLGQCGPVMIELVLQHGEGPTAFRDMYGPDEEGLHHMATFVPDLDAEIARLEAMGYEAANVATTEGGVRFAYVDTRRAWGTCSSSTRTAPSSATPTA